MIINGNWVITKNDHLPTRNSRSSCRRASARRLASGFNMINSACNVAKTNSSTIENTCVCKPTNMYCFHPKHKHSHNFLWRFSSFVPTCLSVHAARRLGSMLPCHGGLVLGFPGKLKGLVGWVDFECDAHGSRGCAVNGGRFSSGGRGSVQFMGESVIGPDVR